jgi:AraC family L-rhamnose operon transcriptional activator RhaR
VHTHSFVEIAFVVSGEGVHNCLNSRHEIRPGDVILLRPGSGTGTTTAGT